MHMPLKGDFIRESTYPVKIGLLHQLVRGALHDILKREGRLWYHKGDISPNLQAC